MDFHEPFISLYITTTTFVLWFDETVKVTRFTFIRVFEIKTHAPPTYMSCSAKLSSSVSEVPGRQRHNPATHVIYCNHIFQLTKLHEEAGAVTTRNFTVYRFLGNFYHKTFIIM